VRYLFDTDILSGLMRRSPSLGLVRRVASVPPVEQATTAITLGELLYGATRLGPTGGALLARVEALVSENLPILPFDEDAARRYGRLRAALEAAGTPIGDADMRIASIALARGLVVVTANTRHFERVPDLMVENWLTS
jgi:tRNA(fMet)-specific endonuclease VapC